MSSWDSALEAPVPEFTLAQYNAWAAEVWADHGLGPDEPDLAAQVGALRLYGPPGAARGAVCWAHVAAELRVTRRYIRVSLGEPLSLRHTLEVITLQVPVEARRRGAATRFLQALVQCAAATGRVVVVESVLSAALHRVLVRLGAVVQTHGWTSTAEFEEGGNYVLPPPPLLPV